MKLISNKELKLIATDILLYIDKVCRKNNIRYYLMLGSLIGAIRHQGFIPWDDDIDICLLRSDYEKLMKIVYAEGKYRAICMETDSNYYFTYGRITNINTILRRRPKRKIENFGVFVDVFPIDNAPDEKDSIMWRKEYLDIRSKVWATIPTPYDDFFFGNIIHYVVRYLKEFRTRYKFGVHNFHAYRDSLIECITRFNKIETSRLMIAETESFCVFAREVFDEVVDVDFEGMKVMAPAKYDYILKVIYGDYMNIPSVEKQISGHEFTAYWL